MCFEELNCNIEVDYVQAEKKFNENQSAVPYVYYRWFTRYANWQEDLIQEGYAALWRACCYFKDVGKIKFSTYIINSVHFRMLDYCRRVINKHSHVLSFDSMVISETADGDNLFLVDIVPDQQDFDAKYLLEICMDKLDPKDHEIIQDLLDGYNQEETAARHSISQATVSRRLEYFKRIIIEEKNKYD